MENTPLLPAGVVGEEYEPESPPFGLNQSAFAGVLFPFVAPDRVGRRLSCRPPFGLGPCAAPALVPAPGLRAALEGADAPPAGVTRAGVSGLENGDGIGDGVPGASAEPVSRHEQQEHSAQDTETDPAHGGVTQRRSNFNSESVPPRVSSPRAPPVPRLTHDGSTAEVMKKISNCKRSNIT